jgi:hypothetical protein
LVSPCALSAAVTRRQHNPASVASLASLFDYLCGDVPLIHLRFRCSNCGSGLTDFVVTSTEATGQPR